MNKPLYLIPFVFIYELVSFIIRIPIFIIKYVSIGFFVVNYTVISLTLEILLRLVQFSINVIVFTSRVPYLTSKYIFILIKYVFKGTIMVCYMLYYNLKLFIRYLNKGLVFLSYIEYHLIKYVVYGFIFPLMPLVNLIKKQHKKLKIYQSTKKEREDRKFEIKRLEYVRRHEERLKKDEEVKAKRLDIIAERKKRKEKDKDEYHNENVIIEKKTFADRLNDILTVIVNVPSTFVKKSIAKYNNLTLIKNMRNKKDIERESLMMSFTGDDAERSDIKMLYEYVAKSPEGKVTKGYFDAFSKVEVHSFLLSEDYEVYSIKTSKLIRFIHGNTTSSKPKIKIKDLIFFLTQLSTYIKAGIPLVEALKILSRQFKNKAYQRIFRSLIYDLTMGETFSDALTKQGTAFPRLLVNMVKASEMTGQLPEVLDDMCEYFTEVDKTKKQMATAMMYPAIILFVAVAVITFILIFVIPRFVQIYETMDAAQIPAFTKWIVALSAFIQYKGIYVVIGIIAFVILFMWLYKNLKLFKTMVQWIIMHIPVFGTIIIYNEVTMFTKTFASLLSHNVFITDSMDILNKITDNEIYKMLILDTITNLAKGEKISQAFEDHWAFPIPAYEMIVTGEKTGELPEMMSKVASYYQELHANSVTRMKTFIEPVLIIFLTVVVGGIVLAIVIPMFNMYSSIQA